MMMICLPVISNRIVEAFFVFFIRHVEGFGQIACHAAVLAAGHPATVAP